MEDNIKHIVFLMLENQSFDRLLSCFSQQADVEGVRAAS
jgi:phospholipase C